MITCSVEVGDRLTLPFTSFHITSTYHITSARDHARDPQSHRLFHVTSISAMYHKDGIEVYLKPRRDNADTLRFPELTLDNATGKDCERTRSCAIPVIIEAEAKVILRFSSTFRMFSADTLSVTLVHGSVEGSRRHFVLSRRRIPGQQQEYHYASNDRVNLVLRSADGKSSTLPLPLLIINRSSHHLGCN